MRTWYRIENAADDPSVVDIQIIDFIGDWIDDYFGFGVTAKAFVDQLSKLSANVSLIRVHINSPGGDVFAAVNIANALRDQQVSKGRRVETIVDGLAASAASIVMMAGSPVRMADNALVMIHNPWSVGIGNAADMRKLADDLDVVRDTIIATYRWHSELSEAALAELMDAETWMDADEALANGFATEKVEGLKAAASINPKALAALTIPEKFQARVQALVAPPTETPAEPPVPEAASAADVLRLCREGDCLDRAEALIAAHATLDAVQADITGARAARESAAVRAQEITAICRLRKVEDLAAGYIAGGMSVDAVRAQVAQIGAKLDGPEIDGGLNPDHDAHPRARINVAAVYAERNRVAQ